MRKFHGLKYLMIDQENIDVIIHLSSDPVAIFYIQRVIWNEVD